jgi:hypothetical protein
LHHNETETITGDGRQDNDDQRKTGAVAPGSIRKHADIITSELRLVKGQMGDKPEKPPSSEKQRND